MTKSDFFITAMKGEDPDVQDVLFELDLTIRSPIMTAYEAMCSPLIAPDTPQYDAALETIYAVVER